MSEQDDTPSAAEPAGAKVSRGSGNVPAVIAGGSVVAVLGAVLTFVAPTLAADSWVPFVRAMLALVALAGLGVALYGIAIRLRSTGATR